MIIDSEGNLSSVVSFFFPPEFLGSGGGCVGTVLVLSIVFMTDTYVACRYAAARARAVRE